MEGSGVSRPNGRQGTDRVPCPLLACDTPHIIKGRIVKVIRTESEEKFSAQGNHIGSEVKETITNKMIFNVLTPNGFKALT